MKKILFLFGVIISCIFILISCGNEIEESKANTNIVAKDEKYVISSNKYERKDVRISYPVISGLSDKNKEYRINKIIRDNALKGLNYYVDDEDIDLKIVYEVKLNNSRYLSIIYYGVGYFPKDAHPTNHFYTTNIDIENGCIVRLNDIVSVGKDLATKIKSGEYIPTTNVDELKNILATMNVDSIYENLLNADDLDRIGTEHQSNYFSYINEDSIGISIEVPHAIGDHVEYELSDEEIGFKR